jgi:hypothetical protein
MTLHFVLNYSKYAPTLQEEWTVSSPSTSESKVIGITRA